MKTTPTLGIPLLETQQQQPNVTYNEGVFMLSGMATNALTRGGNTPPSSPAIGDAHIVGNSPSGSWSGRANCIAIYTDGGWRFVPWNDDEGTPISMGSAQTGLTIYSIADTALYLWDGTDWVEFSGGGGGAVNSVNGQTGTVVLDADDIDDSSTSHKFVTAGDLATLANTSGTNTGDQTDISGNAGTVTTIAGKIQAGANVGVSGAGTDASPYVISSSGGGGGISDGNKGDITVSGSGAVWEINDTAVDLDKLDITQDMAYALIPIGSPFPVLQHLAGVNPPSNAGDAKFIKLTASDAYNTGFLTNESITGTAPLVVATADIDYVGSPMNGETIHLLNTENRYLMPHNTSGGVANDQMQQITGVAERLTSNVSPVASGALSLVQRNINILNPGSAGFTMQELHINSANSPNARTGDHTNVKHQQVTYYMRIA